MNKRKRTLSIVGLGLIGGCYAKTLRDEFDVIYGIDLDEKALSYAESEEIIDKGFKDPELPLSESDLTVVCLYPNLVEKFIEENKGNFKPNAVITDAAGIKGDLLDRVMKKLPSDIDFVGAHPMAGREVQGVWNSSEKIFSGANFIITPHPLNRAENVDLIEKLAYRMGFKRVSRITPKKHDEIISFTSQLTHAIAVALVNSDEKNFDTNVFIGDSYRDLTRIAMINEELWDKLFMGNKENLIKKIERFEESLDIIKNSLKKGDSESLKEEFKKIYHEEKGDILKMEKLYINLEEKSYDIFIDRGIFEEVGEYISKVYKKKKIVVVTDTNVDKLYGDKLLENLKMSGYTPTKVVFEAGEENKNFDILTEVYEKIIDSEIKRGDLLIALGGGVVGDLAGFAASTIYRGIDFIQIPTTLLAQVDSSVGGKVAVDTTRGKNLVGSFYQPKMVIIDPNFLKTLDEREVRSGMAEVIKYGAIYDPEFFDYLLEKKDLKNSMEDIEKIIKKCCEIKAKIVEIDEMDLGLRMILNFGHTLGHAIEKHYNYTKYTHGEAISIGMYEITKLGERLGITKIGESEKIKEILKKYELPIEDEVRIEDLIEIMKTDKKNISGVLNFIFLFEIGKVEIKKIAEEEIAKWM